MVQGAHLAPAPLPVGETGGSKRQGEPGGGGSPAFKGRSKSGSAQARARPSKAKERAEARKTGETARVGAGISRRFTLARARGGAP
jgi:hypothetical protein